MNDNGDNVTYLKTNVTKEIDKESLSYFLQGATEYAAYQDAEAFAQACLGVFLWPRKKRLVYATRTFIPMPLLSLL
jgi:hypothetical protein